MYINVNIKWVILINDYEKRYAYVSIIFKCIFKSFYDILSDV